jgi:hypothetical protein
MKNKFSPKELKRIFNLIKTTLPSPEAKILYLSLAGPRAWGWGNKTMPYEIYGVFHSKNLFNRIFFDSKKEKVHLLALKFLLDQIPYQLGFECALHFSLPIYSDPSFDYKKIFFSILPHLIARLPPEIEIKRSSILTNPEFFDVNSILRHYFIFLVRIHFLKTGQIELNLIKLNKKYRFKMVPILKKKILSSQSSIELTEKKQIIKDFRKLLKDSIRLIRKVPSSFNLKKWEELKKEIKTPFP